MKFLVCFLAVAVFATVQGLTDEQTARLDKISDECRAKTGVTKEMIQKARNGEEVDEPKLRAQALCMCKKVGTMTDDGEIKKHVVKSKILAAMPGADETKVDKVITECCVKKATPEETAIEMLKCLKKHKDLNKDFSLAD